MKRTIRIVTLFLILCSGKILSQEKKWTLEECINYAVTNNIELQRQRLQTQSAEVNYLKAKMDVLPSLNFGSDAALGYGRSINQDDNSIIFSQIFSTSYSLNSSIILFNGFSTLNTISANKFMLNAGLEKEKIVRNTLIVDILGQYYQVIYSKGLEDASKMQLDLSEKQLFRIQKMVETGKEALSRQYEIESQVSADRLAYTIAQNSASQALTTLKQMLQLEPSLYFDVFLPDLNNMLIADVSYNTDSIYAVASQTLPRLKAIEFELKASQKQIAATKGSIAPRLSVGGGFNTQFSHDLNLNDTIPQISFNDQIRKKLYQGVYASLDIPIFNNYVTGRNIKLAKIRKNDTELRLELEKNNLYTEIENVCLNFNRGKDEFYAAQSNLEYNKKSFNAVEKKFESGLTNVTDFSSAKTELFKAEAEELRTKLQLLIRKLILQFYCTGEYENILNN